MLKRSKLKQFIISVILFLSFIGFTFAREMGDEDGLGDIQVPSEEACVAITNYVYQFAVLRDSGIPLETVLYQYDLEFNNRSILISIIRQVIQNVFIQKSQSGGHLASQFYFSCMGSGGSLGTKI